MPQYTNPNPGEKRRRIRGGYFTNPTTGAPTLTGVEQWATRLADGSEELGADTGRQVSLTFTPGATFPIRNKQTDELTGEVATHEQLAQLLYSIQRAGQLALDTQESQP